MSAHLFVQARTLNLPKLRTRLLADVPPPKPTGSPKRALPLPDEERLPPPPQPFAPAASILRRRVQVVQTTRNSLPLGPRTGPLTGPFGGVQPNEWLSCVAEGLAILEEDYPDFHVPAVPSADAVLDGVFQLPDFDDLVPAMTVADFLTEWGTGDGGDGGGGDGGGGGGGVGGGGVGGGGGGPSPLCKGVDL